MLFLALKLVFNTIIMVNCVLRRKLLSFFKSLVSHAWHHNAEWCNRRVFEPDDRTCFRMHVFHVCLCTNTQSTQSLYRHGNCNNQWPRQTGRRCAVHYSKWPELFVRSLSMHTILKIHSCSHTIFSWCLLCWRISTRCDFRSLLSTSWEL